MEKTLSERRANLIALGVIVISVILSFILYRQIFLYAPSEKLEWLTYSEEHFNIGEQLYHTGKLLKAGYVNTERPPGYPVFVASVLHARDLLVNLTLLPGGKTLFGSVISNMMKDDETVVLLSHFLVSIAAGFLLFRIMRTIEKSYVAFLVVFAYLFSVPYFSLILKRDYSLLETFFILILLFLSQKYFQHAFEKSAWKYLILLGIAVGIICLFRPVYLLFPGFFFLAVWIFRKEFLPACKHAAIVLLFMLLILTPNVIRNYRVSGRFILISEQGGVELYHNSVESYFSSPEFTQYGKVWDEYGWPLMRDNLGIKEYSAMLWYTDTARISDLFWNAAIDQIVKEPMVYIGNVIYNLGQIITMDLDYWGYRLIKENSNNIIEYYSYVFYLWFMQIVGSASIILVALKANKNFRISILLLTVTLLISYSLVFFYPRYIYLKYPLYLLGIGFLIGYLRNACQGEISRWGAVIIATGLIISSSLPLAMVAIRYFTRF